MTVYTSVFFVLLGRGNKKRLKIPHLVEQESSAEIPFACQKWKWTGKYLVLDLRGEH